MSLALLFPLGLAALAAWLLPLLIHLHRHEQRQVTVFAALRWLQARPRPQRRLRLEEWPLLALRLLLLAALALLLARPVLQGATEPEAWVVVAPDAVLPDDLAAGDAQRRWLAPGFPALDAPAPAAPVPLGSLLRELDASLPPATPLTVVVPSVVSGADAERPVLGRPVQWRVVAGAMPSAAAPRPPARPPLSLRHAPEHAAALRYLRAAAIAWHTGREPAPAVAEVFDAAGTDAALPPRERPLLWLARGPLPATLRAWIEGGGTALVAHDAQAPELARAVPLWRDEAGDVLVRAATLGRGRLLQWTRPLAPEALPVLLEAEFPERLRALFAAPAPAPTRVAAADYAPREGTRTWPQPARDLQPWLWWLIAALFLLERWFASGRRTGGRA